MPNTALPRLDRRAVGVIILIVLTLTAMSAAGTDDFTISTVTPVPNQTLTEPVRWNTTVSGLYADRVEYFIDDELRWSENYEPYFFNGDDGWLAPSTLTPGRHVLKAVAYHHGQEASSEVVVNVPAAAAATSTTPAPTPSDGGAGTKTGTTSGSATSGGTTSGGTTSGSGSTGGTSTPTPSGTNLAAGKPTSSSSVETPAYAARYSVDGDPSTRWSSSYADGQWWQVDLGAPMSVSSVAIDWEVAYAASYRIQVSTDGTSFGNVVLESANSDGVKQTSFAPVVARYVRVLGLTRGTPYGISAWEVAVYGSGSAPSTAPTVTPTPVPSPLLPTAPAPTVPSTSNLAAGMPTTASSTENGSFTASRAVDGKASTRWGSAYADRQWWQVDLGATRMINRVSVDWEYARPSSYRLQVSSNGNTFADVAQVSIDDPGLESTSFTAVSARYVRVFGVSRATEFGISAWEVGVYGPGDPTTQSIPPVPTAPSSVTAPTISGLTTVGSTLTAGTGTWANTPTSFTYAWQRCNTTGGSCVAITGAAATTYKLVTADVGSTIRVRVQATNTGGNAAATSTQTGLISAAAPPPSVSTAPLGSKLPARLPTSQGGDYYVDGRSGSDSNPGSLSAPWRSIAKAWSVVPAGAVINVRAGTYTQQTFLTGRAPGASTPITLRPYAGETVLLQNVGGVGAAVYIEGVNGLRIEGFRISNPSSDGIKVTNSSNVELVRNEVYGNGNQAIIVIGDGSGGQTYSSNVQIWSNRIHGNGVLGSGAFNHGIYYGASSDPNDGGTRRGTLGGVIANNIVYDQPTGYLLQLGPQADGVIVTNNTLTGARSQDPNTGSAIALWGTGGPLTTRNVVIVNNVMAFNVKSALHETDDVAGHATVHHNLSYANLGDDGTSSLLDGANVTGVDPLFVDRGGGDFRPRAGSPTIGRADRVYAPPTDAAGASRGSSPEIGAFELVPRKTVAARR